MRDQDQLSQLVQDAWRFVMYHRGAIESYPLQTYASALLFSPSSSLIRKLFQHEEPKGIIIWPAMSYGRSACLQTLKGHSNSVTSVAFSHDLAQLASVSWNSTVKIWDASSGACLKTLHIGKILYNLSFDPTGSRLYTDIGTIVIPSSEVSSAKASSTNDTEELAQPLYQGTSLSADGMWIKHAENNMLWVPSEYRPSCSSVSGFTVAVGVGSGRVWSCRIDP